MQPTFIHLRLHTEYSLNDSVIRVPELMQELEAMRMPAVALTDQSNLFALVKFYNAAQAYGIKPIIGADMLVHDAEGNATTNLTLLCCDKTGYKNLSVLITRCYVEGQHRGIPLLDKRWLNGHTQGLIALSGGRGGDIGRALLSGRTDHARLILHEWLAMFSARFYLELQRTGREDEEEYLKAAVLLASETGVPLVATNDVRFIKKSDFDAHEARVCIQSGHVLNDPRRPRTYSQQQYLRSQQEMLQLFSDLPEALENSVEIAKRCNFDLRLGENYLPAYTLPEGQSAESYLRSQAQSGLENRLVSGDISTDQSQSNRAAAYRERLVAELNVIVNMGFAGYFLIVADFIRWAKQHDVPVGPGRGSGAGSLVAYALEITDLDPLKYNLLFERFLNPERVSMPDFDVDFCMEGRDRVIDYVADRYGRDRVSQIITYGSMAARAVVRDVGRVLGHPYGYVDRIAKLIPFELGMTLNKALQSESELRNLYEGDDEVHQLIDLALSLEGLARNAGKHAGGVVIAPSPLTDFMPLYCEQGGVHQVTQFDKDDVEALGLVKFDFLGLRTLTIINWAVKAINARRSTAGEALLDMAALPLDDPETYTRIFKHSRTVAVFQFESSGMRRLLKEAQPDCFEDLIALGALYRPGPMELIPIFVARKRGRETAKYPDQRVEPILKETYGIMVYQEQVMQMAQIIGGYTLGGADLLRRAMGKKKPEEMAKHRAIFREGAARNGLTGGKADQIFDLMEKFAGYGFNKSHSAAYALISYQTAWLKAHYPAAFMASVLTSDMDHTDKIVTLIDECRAMELKILPPDINHSNYRFEMADDGSIRYGLGAIKGVGLAAIEGVLEERQRHGAFSSIEEFCRRIDVQKANRRVIEALIRSGTLDSLGVNRATLMAQLPEALARADQSARAKAAGQNDMFGLHGVKVAQPQKIQPGPQLQDWDESERLRGERDTLGLFLSGHPIAGFADDLRHVVSAPLGELSDASLPDNFSDRGFGAMTASRSAIAAGLIVDMRKRGGRVNLTLDDRSGRLEVTLFEDMYTRFRNLAVKDNVVVVEGRLSYDEFIGGWRMTVKHMYGIDELRERYVRRLDIEWPDQAPGDFASRLKALLKPHVGGHCNVWVKYRGNSASVPMCLGEAWRVHPSIMLTRSLESWLGSGNFALHYGARPLDAARGAAGA
ncbi:MAG: DNA polymerase III subunit alpha [Gammaproteobacteria bacterium]|nr:DNA polymerase III subunit alpha [Gammaproteobacteria bacterium]MDE2346194.1 DNA polymerase III subunit alpha [Gammaproteobacteria bacterium]